MICRAALLTEPVLADGEWQDSTGHRKEPKAFFLETNLRMQASWWGFKSQRKQKRTCLRTCLFRLWALSSALTHPALLPKLSAQHGPTMTYQSDRIWHAKSKATPQLNRCPFVTRAVFHFHSSLMHQQNSVNQKIRDYAPWVSEAIGLTWEGLQAWFVILGTQVNKYKHM